MQGAVDKVGNPRDVFLALHHHFLCLADAGLRLAGAEDDRHSLPEQTVLSAAVSRDPEGERELCARAMAALYHAHAAAIGAPASSPHSTAGCCLWPSRQALSALDHAQSGSLLDAYKVARQQYRGQSGNEGCPNK